MRATKTATLALLVLLSLAFLLQGDLPTVPTGTWAPANSLTEGRSASAAAPLQDGRILFTGGTGVSGPLASAELFNTDGSFSPAAPMQNPRANHTAVVLQDGRVLVAGGTTSGGGITSAAEIYDPASNSWTPVAGGMTAPRSNHTASLLKDGTVLMAGGLSTSGALNSLEIYDPVVGAFAAVNSGTLSSARQDHAAAVLADGRVLIAGGSDGTNSLSSTDIYDSSAGRVSAAAKMSGPRTKLSATTLIDGRVLVAGGNGGTADLATAEIYNPAAGTLSATGSLATARSGHLALLLPNNSGVLIVGGSSAGTPLSSAELFYPWTGTFNATGGMAAARIAAAGAPLKQNGVLLVAGGTDGTNQLASGELYGFATIKTDKADYQPGETVSITGMGWQPGETVTLTFLESPNLDTHPPLTAVADANGNISNTQFSPDSHDVEVLFYLTATGSVSQAQTIFTDGNASSGDGAMVVSPTIVAAGSTGNTLTFTFTATNGKDFNANSQAQITVPAVPAGWTPPAPGNVTVTNGSCTSASLASATGGLITVNMVCPGGDNFTVTYSPTTVPASASTSTFTTKTKQGTPLGSFLNIGTSPTVTVQAASKLVFLQQPMDGQAGSSITPAVTVQVQDANGDLVNTSTASVTIAIANNPGGGTLAGTATVAAVNGVATFSNLSINKTGAGYTLSASSAGLTTATSAAFNITPSAPTHLVFGQQPTNAQAGASITPALTVQVLDANNNLLTAGTGSAASITMAIGTNPSGGTLAGTTTVVASGGIATFSNLSINKVGTGYTLTAASSGLAGTASSAFNITSGTVSAGASTVSANPASVTADGSTSSTITVTLTDGSGNPAGGKTVTLSQGTGSSAITPASGTTNGSGQILFTVKDTKAEAVTYTATDTTDTITITQTATVTFTAGAVNAGTSTVSASPTSVVADGTSTSTITVTLKDANNNPVGGKTVTLTPGGGSSTITTVSGTTNASGQATFTVKDTTVESVTYTAKDTTDSITVTQTATVTFTVGPVNSGTSTVSANPTSVTADGTTTSTITVTLKDASNRAISGKTVTLAPGAGSSTISAASGPSNASGVVTFTVKDTKAEAVAYTATDSTDSVTITQTATVTFTAGAVNAGASTVSANPTSVTADGSATSTITVTLEDVRNNPVSGKTVILSQATGSSTITTVSGTTNASGQASFTVKDTKAESVTYTAQDTTDSITVTQTATVTFTPGPLAHFAIGAISSPQTAGTAFNITVTAQDANNNTVTSFTANGNKVMLNSTGTLTGAPITTTAFTNGVLSPPQSVTITNTGTFTITATGTGGNSGATGTSNSFQVNPGAPNKLAFLQQPTNTPAGSAITPAVTVQVEDQFNNVVTSGTGGTASVSVAIGTNPGSGTLSGATSVSAVGGIATFSNLSISKGGTGYTLVMSSSGLTSATSNLFTINNPAPTLSSIAPTNGNLSTALDVVLTGSGFITGVSSVSFGPDITVNTTTVNTVSQITAHITIPVGATVGAHSVSVTNSGPGGGTSATQTFTVNNPATTTVLGSSPNPSLFGQGVLFTAAVTSVSGTPTGSVTFIEGGTCQTPTVTWAGPTGLDVNGHASFATAALTVPSHIIVACYTPTGIYTGSFGSVTQLVSQATPTVSDSGPTSSTFGQPVTLSVTITPPAGGTPTGTVTFSFVQNATTYYVCADGSISTTPCSVPVTLNGSNYVASVSTSKLPTAADNVMATYSGDTNFQGEPANTVSVTVSQADTATTLTKSPDPSVYGDSVVLTVTVKDNTANSTGLPTGTVTLSFKVDPNDRNAQLYYICGDGSILTTACVDPNQISLDQTATATVTTKNLPAGVTASTFAYAINASYSGDTNFKPSAPFGLSQTVNPRPITVTAATDTKNYDGTTHSAGVPTITTGTLANGDTANFTESFDNRNAGMNKTLTPAGTVNDGYGGNNYAVTFTSVNSGVISPLAITVTAVADKKTYDGTTSSAKSPAIAPVLVSGDTSGFTQTFDNRNVGTGKTLTASGSVNDGNSGNNYAVTFVKNINGEIDAATLTITAMTNTKIYDSTTSAAATPAVTGLQLGDTVSATESYDTKNVGTGKTLSVATSTVTDGNSGHNYTVTTVTNTTGVINQAPLSITAVTNSKTYDATTFAGASPAVSGLQGTDTVTGLSETYDTPTAATGKTLSVASYTVNDGNGGGNYAVVLVADHTGVILQATPVVVDNGPPASTFGQSVTLSVTVTPPSGGTPMGTVTFSFAQNTTTYYVCSDGSISTTLCTVPVALNGSNYVASVTTNKLPTAADSVMATYSGDTNFLGEPANNVSLTVSQADSATTLIKSQDPSTYGDAVDLTVKVKDNTANSTGVPTGTVTLSFKLDPNDPTAQLYYICGDGSISTTACVDPIQISLSPDSNDTLGLTATATVHTTKLPAGLTASAFAYAINASYAGDTNFKPSGPVGLTQTVNQSPITVTAATDTKTYDGTASSSGKPTVTGSLVNGDTGNFTQTFDTRNAGTGKTLTPSGSVNDGFDGNNYVLTFTPVSTGVISPLAITVTAVTDTKTYDGTTVSSKSPGITPALINPDSSGFTQVFDSKNAGSRMLVPSGSANDGNLGHNYSVTFASIAGTINQRALTIAATGLNKVYDGNTTATVTLSDNRVSGDVFTDSYTSAGFADKNAGTGKTVSVSGISLSGTDAGNYTFNSTATTTANITARPLAVSAAGVNKMYDGTTAATVTLSDNRISGDVFTDNYTSASFADKNAGTGKTASVSGISLLGADAGNYTFNSTATTTANITARPLAVSAAGVNKMYDGTTAATVTLSDNRISGDVFTDNYTSASFADKNAGTGKTVSVTGISLLGTDAGNYTFNSTATTTANITARPLAVSAAGVNKVYDGTTAAMVTLSDNRISGDNFTDNYTSASFADKNVGMGKTVSVSGISLSGTDAGNYTFNTTATTTANITQASTSTVLAVSPAGPVNYGQLVTLTATVTDATPSTPTSTVTFYNGTSVLGTGTLNGSGLATYSTFTLAVGSHSFTALYGGDSNFAGSNSNASPVLFTVNSTGPLASVNLPSVQFLSPILKTTSTAVPITLTNIGTAALTISGITLGGANKGDFAIQSNNCPMSLSTLSPLASCIINVTNTPQAAGTRTATLTITDNSTSGSTQMVSLSAVALSSIASNFNGTAIGGGDTIWFNAVLSPKGIDHATNPVSIYMSQSTIAFTSGSNNYTVPVPNSVITFDPGVTSATISFDASNRWMVTVPASGLAGNTFLNGVPFVVPAGGLPGGIKNVTWQGLLTTDTPGVTLNWQWGAAVYTNAFSTDYNAIGVKPVDDSNAMPWKNSDHAGTPENYKQYVTGGAAGGGGSNWTGSYSGTAGISPAVAPLNINPDALAFDNTAAGNTGTTCGSGGPCTVTIVNPGIKVLTLGTQVIGINATEFAIKSNNCPGSLASAGTCTISLTFTPMALGTRSAILSITSTPSGGSPTTQTVDLSGNGM